MVAIKINAGNDKNGNGRRGWIVYAQDGDLIDFVRDDGTGEWGLYKRYPEVVALEGTIPVTPGFFRERLRDEAKTKKPLF